MTFGKIMEQGRIAVEKDPISLERRRFAEVSNFICQFGQEDINARKIHTRGGLVEEKKNPDSGMLICRCVYVF